MMLLFWNRRHRRPIVVESRGCPIVMESPSCRRKGEFMLLYGKKSSVVVIVVAEERGILHVGHEREGCVYRRWNLEGEIGLWAKV